MKRRQESSTGMYHVMVKGINKERIFNQQREKSYLIKIILKHLELFKVEIYSYCIMSNHAHFIIRSEIQILSRFITKKSKRIVHESTGKSYKYVMYIEGKSKNLYKPC